MLEIGQAHHQARWLRGPSERSIEATKLLIEMVPIDQTCQPEQLMAMIEDLIETAAVEVAGVRHRRLGSHRKTPYVDGPRLARCGSGLIGSLAVICPASVTAVAHDRGPRWVPRRKFQTALRPVAAIGVSGASHVSDRSITPSTRPLQVPASAQHRHVEGAAAVLANALDGVCPSKRV